MQIVKSYPPNIADIRAVLPVTANNIFCYGDTIYSPSTDNLSGALLAHEAVHQKQQGDNPHAWWQKFLADPKFRLEQELPAHQAEYRYMMSHTINRTERRRVKKHGLKALARRLAHPMYGGIISQAEAARRISM